MARRRQVKFFGDGVLVVDKPAGPTSHDVVERLRRRFKPAKLGHTGTLDPFATGVLVLAFNRATRMASLLGAGDKLYQGRLSLGAATDTGDPTGQVQAQAPVPVLSPEQVRAALQALEGPRQQAPPPFSAAKHQGRPLYAYARQGLAVHKEPRAITVHQARLLALEPEAIVLELSCSRGTYVRSLAADLAQALGTVGHLQALRRLASAPFSAGEAVSLEQALALDPAELAQRLIGLDAALERCGLSAVVLEDEQVWQLRQGRILPREALLAGAVEGAPARGPFRVLDQQGQLVAVLRWLEPGQRLPGRDYENVRVFPEQPEGLAVEETSASAGLAE
ncbi:MAG: tRNA pseudouridine(55) synthase TruB [Desulfarculus sp.]|nr:MAG: tRNA pseudouridine(55) synthase TruB [Desulfarculus sp.]